MKLGDVAYYVTKRVSADKVTKDTYISTENMRPNKDGFMPSDELPPYPSYTSYDEHDILISNIRPYFKKILYAKANGGCSNDVLVLRAKDPDNYSSSFLYYALSQDYFFNFMMAGAKGTKMPRGNKKSILDFELPEYNLAKQERIATILSHYDDLIEINKRRIALLEESARELYKEWFVRMRFPGWRKEKTTAGIPSEWEIKNISQICDISAGKDRPEQVSPAKSKEFPYPIYSNGVDNNGLYGFASSPRVANNCITISARGTIGFVVLHLFPFVPIVRLLVLVPQKENLLYYLYLWAKCIPIEGNGTSQQQLTVPMIGKEKIIIPTEEILDQFNTYINELVGIKDNLIHANELLSLQRDRLLPRLMSGQLEV